MPRPYTTAEMIELFAQHGVTFNSAYFTNVIRRRPAHPLYHAKIARGMWARGLVDDYFSRRPELDGRRTRYTKKAPD